jgi:hypothetical protein
MLDHDVVGSDCWGLTFREDTVAKGSGPKPRGVIAPEDARRRQVIERAALYVRTRGEYQFTDQLLEVLSRFTYLLLDETERLAGLDKGTRDTDEGAIAAAVADVRAGLLSYEKAAKKHGVSHSTIYRRVTGSKK